MSADMTGYLLKGPAKLPKNAEKIAEKELLNLRKRLLKNPKVCGNCGNKLEDGCPCYCGWPVIGKDATDGEIRSLAKELVEGWTPDNRDTASRLDPDNRKKVIVFAGDMSWGDEPEGGGYQYLKKLCLSGVAEALKIR